MTTPSTDTWVKLGGTTVGINPDCVQQLATVLGTAISSASSLARTIAGISEWANQAALSAAPPGTGTAFAQMGSSGTGWQPDGGALQALIQQAPPVAKEIQTRLNHFNACEQDTFVPPGSVSTWQVSIDRALWFTDEPNPSVPKIDSAIQYFDNNIGNGAAGWMGAWDPAAPAQAILDQWKNKLELNGAELDAVLNSLTPDQLSQLNSVLGKSSSWANDGPDKNLQYDFSTFISSNVGRDTLAKLKPYLPNLQQPTSQEKVNDAINYFQDNIGNGAAGWMGAWDPAAPAQAIYNNWSGNGNDKQTKLNGAELDKVLNSLTPDQLSQLNSVLGKSSSWANDGPDKNLQAKFSSFIFNNAGAGAIRRVLPHLTNLKALQTAALDAGYA